MVFQIQLIKQIDALPLTRDYMLEDERRLRRARSGRRPASAPGRHMIVMFRRR